MDYQKVSNLLVGYKEILEEKMHDESKEYELGQYENKLMHVLVLSERDLFELRNYVVSWIHKDEPITKEEVIHYVMAKKTPLEDILKK